MGELGRRGFLAGAVAASAAGVLTGTGTASADEQGVGLPGTSVRPGDPRYVDLIRGTNQRWVGNPDCVQVVSTPAEVVTAVRAAVTAGKRIGIRSGGHCYEDFVYNGTQVVLDLSELDDIGYDPKANAISVGAGANLFQVYDALYRVWGVTIPGGSCATVGAGGHITGGGYGVNSRMFGLTVDYLYGVEVVTVDASGKARLLVATRDAGDPNRDLWWAHTGGGGGNFGVVTRFLLKSPTASGTDPSTFLPKPPGEILLTSVALDWKDVDETAFTRLVNNYGRWHERNSAPNSPGNAVFSLLGLNKKVRDAAGNATSQIGFTTLVNATVPNARTLLDDHLNAVFDGVTANRTAQVQPSGKLPALPHFQEPQRLPWLQATFELSGGMSWRLRSDYKSAYLRKGHTAEQIAATYKWLETANYNNNLALVQIDSYGGRINSVGAADTVVPQRDSVMKLQYQVYWTDPAEDAKHLAWIRGFYGEVYGSTGGVPVPNAVTDGCYVNYPDIDLQDPAFNRSGVPWSTLYYKDNYTRLRQVKRKYDPRNVFRHRQSIEP
ncbi:BBE domain-containing protein [Kibdelosporangium lantanae]